MKSSITKKVSGLFRPGRNSFQNLEEKRISPASLEEQQKILNKVFQDLGLPTINNNVLKSYKIPKRRTNFVYEPFYNPSDLRQSILTCEAEGKMCYNLPPDLHWSLVNGWPWPRALVTTNDPASSSTPCTSSFVCEDKTISPVDAVISFMKTADWRQQLQYNEKSGKRVKPRFRFDSDRNHDFSDEDISTVPPNAISKINPPMGSDSGTGTGPSPGSSFNGKDSPPDPAQESGPYSSDEGIEEELPDKKLVWKMKISLKDQSIVYNDFHTAKMVESSSRTCQVETEEPVKAVQVLHDHDYYKTFQDEMVGDDQDDDEDILTISIDENEREF